MRVVVIGVTLTVLSLACVACAQEEPAPAAAPPAAQPAPQPAAQPADTPDTKGVLEAQQVLLESSKAYRATSAMTDTLKLQLKAEMQGEQNIELSLAFGKGSDSHLKFPGMSFTAVGEQLYIARDDVRDKYFAAPLEGDMVKTMEKVFGSAGNVPPQFALRCSDTITDYVSSLSLGLLTNPRLITHALVKAEDGTTQHEIRLQGDGGRGAVHINEKTKFVTDITIEITSEASSMQQRVTGTATMNPKVHETLPEPIAFDPGARTKVDGMEQLQPTPLAAGDAAPDFTLKTLQGETVTLSGLKGSVVVLDFWATWCGPCKLALPLLQDFSKWAAESGKPIKVYAVNVWQRETTPEAKTEAVTKFWTEKAYTVPVLMDVDDKVAKEFGFQSIPTTLIVGPEGKIMKIHRGFEKTMVEMLKSDVEEALKPSGS